MRHAMRTGDQQLKQTAISSFIERPFEYGWDQEHGGLYYFLDADGWSPVQLEWDMKLWWAHNEALIAFLMAYKETGDLNHLKKFAQIFDYSYSHVHLQWLCELFVICLCSSFQTLYSDMKY